MFFLLCSMEFFSRNQSLFFLKFPYSLANYEKNMKNNFLHYMISENVLILSSYMNLVFLQDPKV